MTTITKSGVSIIPKMVVGYTALTRSANIIHTIIGRPDPDVSLTDDQLRTGSLTLLFTTPAAAWEAHEMHRHSGVLRIFDQDIPAINMAYVRDGEMQIQLDPVSRTLWTLTIGFQEVKA